MKLSVILDKEEQKKRQTEVNGIYASVLPPSFKNTLVRLIIGGALIAAAIIVFIVIAANNIQTSMTVLAVIMLIVGVSIMSGALYNLFAKKRRTKKITDAAASMTDEMFGELSGAVVAKFDFGAKEVAADFLSETGETVKRLTLRLNECGVTSVCDTLAVDFTEVYSYCFTAEEIGKDALLSLKKLLIAKHESYRDVEMDERGKYYLAASEYVE